MTRKQLMFTLPVLALLIMGGLWAALRPEGSPLLPLIGHGDTESSPKVEVTPLGLDDPDEEASPGLPPANADEHGGEVRGLTEEEKQAAREAREAARLETERREAEGGQPPAERPGSNENPANPERELTEKEKALQAERQRRIDQLRAIKRPPNQSLGNRRPRTRTLKQEFGKKELSEVTPKLKQDRRGLFAKYYAFQQSPVQALLDPEQPTLDQRTPDVTRIDPQVHFPSKEAWADLPFDKRNFMGVWEGFLVIAEDADYWLYIGADYTARVVLSGETVLLNDMRDYTEVSTVLTLSKGLHPIRIEYMEGENGSVVDPLGACNFMWVPEGESKPVPVPPEMLMLPEHLWSDNAPIITKLSRTEGEIGDEITIHGQGLGEGKITPIAGSENEPDGNFQLAQYKIDVTVAGQPARILDHSDASIRIQIPVGAVSGKVTVHKSTLEGWIASSGLLVPTYYPAVPSNSVDFTVTTQFGLFASWHNLEGWSNYDFIDESVHEPDVVRLEREFMFETREELDLPFRNNPLACHWEGKLGIPAGWVENGETALVRFQTYGRLRVKLGEQLKETEAQPGGNFDLTTLDFEVSNHEEHYLPLSIDWTSETGPAGLTVLKMRGETAPMGELGPLEPVWVQVETLQEQLFFPPVVPPKPPEIVKVTPVYAEGEQPPTLPFDVTTTRPSVREGQTCEITLRAFGQINEATFNTLSLTIDGIALPWNTPADGMDIIPDASGGVVFTMTCVLPTGLGEGRIVARQSIVTSEPYYIDVLNKGLLAYLYDLPNPGGYTEMPDVEPLPAFQVRKDPWVNFENANDFDLPFPAETFAIEWMGALIVEREGFYRFTCRSDDGIITWLNEEIVLIDNNLHYQRERTGDWVYLTPGLHKFRMQFFENNVHEVCVLSWEARDDSDDPESEFITRQVIPRRHFTWDDHPPLPSKTSTFKRTDGSDPE